MGERIKKGPWLWYGLAVLLVAADQAVKLLVRQNMPVGQKIPVIPWFIELYHVQNTGAAFSLLAEHTWLLTLLSAAATAGLAVVLWKGWLTPGRVSRTAMTLILAGAAGNLIDRALLGQVTDMFNFTFMTFGVFNVADICVVVGVILLCICLIFTPKEKEKPHGSDHQEG